MGLDWPPHMFVWALVQNYFFNKYILKRDIPKHWFALCQLTLGDIYPPLLQTVAKHPAKVHALIPMLYRTNPSYAKELIENAEKLVRQYQLF